MGDYRSTFKNTNAFLAVVHVENGEQAVRNARIAQDEGADGIFLINHDSGHEELLNIYAQVRRDLPWLWVGLNCLDLGRSALRIIPKTTAGLWVDNAGITETDVVQAKRFNDFRIGLGWKGLYFGGVAFKYQEPVDDVAAVAKAAMPYVDVITTSGDGTGHAPALEKIKKMKVAIGSHPLAIASGITPENVLEYVPYADCFLVATGVSDSHTELNPVRVRALARRLGK
jgi:predicted TIM-barrel enzyme